MIAAPTRRNESACILLEKWGVDPRDVVEADLNERGYYRLASTVNDSLLPERLRGRRLERIWTAWPDDFPVHDFLALLPNHARERHYA